MRSGGTRVILDPIVLQQYSGAASGLRATNLTARSLLMIAIEHKIQENGWTQAKAARVLDVQQPPGRVRPAGRYVGPS
jgi:Helix-turn-helix domain